MEENNMAWYKARRGVPAPQVLGEQTSSQNNLTTFTSATIPNNYDILYLLISAGGYSAKVPIITSLGENTVYDLSNQLQFKIIWYTSNRTLKVNWFSGPTQGWSFLKLFGVPK